jgi:hypothetical protein
MREGSVRAGDLVTVSLTVAMRRASANDVRRSY